MENENKVTQMPTEGIVPPNLGHTDPEKFVDALDKLGRSKGFMVIRDNMTSDMLKRIMEDKPLYQKFQDIRRECKAADELDRKVATMKDVNRACTNVYGLILKIIQSVENTNDAAFNAMAQAINNIEERLGMEPTKLIVGGEEDVAGDAGDVPDQQTGDK